MRPGWILLGFVGGVVVWCVLFALVVAFFMGADEHR